MNPLPRNRLERIATSAALAGLHVHQAIYEVADGRIGHNLFGVRCLLLRTTGRHTGKTRTSALAYARDGDDYLVVGSLGGADRAPSWLHNVRAHPQVGLQVKRIRSPAVATITQRRDSDYDRLWRIINRESGGRYDRYQAKTSRSIPVVRLAVSAPSTLEVRLADDAKKWSDAAALLFGYQRETALEVGADEPTHPQDVWLPVRRETLDPSSVFSTYLISYAQGAPVGGVALVERDSGSTELKRFYVAPQWRRKGVATALVTAADNLAAARGASRLMLDVLPSRTGAITAWRRMGFVDAAPWGDPTMAYFERAVGGGSLSTPDSTNNRSSWWNGDHAPLRRLRSRFDSW